jgi:hypothetical protein
VQRTSSDLAKPNRRRAHGTSPGIGSGMLQSTLARGTRLAHNQRLIDRRRLRGKAHARAIADARVNAKHLGRQPRARDKSKDYPPAEDSFWATDQDEDDPELGLELTQGPSIAHPPRTVHRPRLAPPASTTAAVGQAHAQRQRRTMRSQV